MTFVNDFSKNIYYLNGRLIASNIQNIGVNSNNGIYIDVLEQRGIKIQITIHTIDFDLKGEDPEPFIIECVKEGFLDLTKYLAL